MEDDLRNYKLQLQQVEAALVSDPDNDELLKLKCDLEEVISLTKDLIKTQQEESCKPTDDRSAGYLNRNNQEEDDDDDVTASLLAAERGIANNTIRKRKWKVGDKCSAKWEVDGQYYDAIIDEIIDSKVNITFSEYNQKESVNIDEIREVGGVKRSADEMGDDSKHGKPPNRDYLKKKKQKKQQRFKQIEEDRESEKNKWLSFKAKTSKNPGIKTKSIFASPENLNGRVGIGTCGISGKPMTEFIHGEKWKKGA